MHTIDTVVAMPARLWQFFIEVVEQDLATAASLFTECKHGIELVLLDALVTLVTL
ncbi:hypothetical protein D3C77_816450 [compost metagenome]